MVKRHNHLKIGWYHQHLAELLDLSLTPLEYMFREFPEVPSYTFWSQLHEVQSAALTAS